MDGKHNVDRKGRVNYPASANYGRYGAPSYFSYPELLLTSKLSFCLGLPAEDGLAGGGGFVEAREARGVRRVADEVG
jgi:hypothetical protein